MGKELTTSMNDYLRTIYHTFINLFLPVKLNHRYHNIGLQLMGSESNTLVKLFANDLRFLRCNECSTKLSNIALSYLYNRYYTCLDYIVPGQLQSQVILRCPVDNSDMSASRITRTWFRGHGAFSAWAFSEPDGDLTIYSITVKDFGFIHVGLLDQRMK